MHAYSVLIFPDSSSHAQIMNAWCVGMLMIIIMHLSITPPLYTLPPCYTWELTRN